ncbi:acetyl-CoA synthetase-like protein [Fistulina hepatica ATCC 64428]|uniref:Acetyl-CoA synthetase-like protein n=1 Tax=Fistulina hepatica ATCC 64428 TaxID=1128425 RepID=A0A0D7A320_9AGAR|nr:acetyl-CoA synthetase-like protein [Fistulina hepatica ATCC 64428]
MYPVDLAYPNPLYFLLRAASIFPNKIALSHPDRPHPVQYTYSVWTQRVQNLAYAIIKAGIRSGDTVAVLAPNSNYSYFGVIAARAISCPINTRLSPQEVKYILDHSQSRLLLVDHEYVHLIKDTAIPFIVCNDTGKPGDPYEDFLESGRQFSNERGWPGLVIEADETLGACLCYTSGTTARPKGVLTTLRGSYLAAISNVTEAQLTRASVYLWILPMFHAAGWTYPWANVYACATQVTIRAVSYPVIWRHFYQSGITHYCGAPTVQIGIVNEPTSRRLERPITAIIAGSAPTAHLIQMLEEKNIKPVHVYGLTETYGPFMRTNTHSSWATLNAAMRAKLMARQGNPFPTAQEARVVYPTENDSNELVDVPRDGKTVGEIVTRGNLTMKEYFRDPETTRIAFRGGSFHSGDLAVMHGDGTIAVVDRSKDIIISGGENISSLAVEQELATHPHVLEVSVVARTHPKWGERPLAFVILRPQHTKKWADNHQGFEGELKEFARARLPGFACPEWVRIVEELPKTSTGKIQKNVLRGISAKL